MESIVLAVLAFACGAAATFIAALVYINRREPDEPLDWTEEAYQPRLDQPRAVTRIKSNDIFWEVK
jgi:hypothetical protein